MDHMTFFTINYKYNDLQEAKQLATVMDQKLEALQKFIPKDAAVTCEVEFERVGAHLNGTVHRVEINLTINGTVYRAEATEESFERAIDVVRNELARELRRAKEKQGTLRKRAGRIVKSLLSFS